MSQIDISENKTLKLQNVLKKMIAIQDIEGVRIETEISRMQSFILTRGARQIGPLIQQTTAKITESGEVNFFITFMLQCDKFLHDVSDEYETEAVIRVENCLYARYIGPEEKMKFAYDKLNVYAFENDIVLREENYTIFVNKNEEEETMVADVFMPIAE